MDDLEALVHRIAAMAAFLLVGSGMLLQSAALHRDPHWRGRALAALLLALLAFAGLWLYAWRLRAAPR